MSDEDRRDQRLRDDREEDHHQPLLVRPEVLLEPLQLAEEVRLLEDARPDARLDGHLAPEIVGELRVPRLVGVDLVRVLDHRLREVEARPAPADHRRDRVDRSVLELGRELEVGVQLLDQHAVDRVGAELLDERVLRDRHELGREVDVLARLLLADLPPRLRAHAGARVPAPERARVRGLGDPDRPHARGLRCGALMPASAPASPRRPRTLRTRTAPTAPPRCAAPPARAA